MRFWRETPRDDHARTGRILESLEAAYALRTGDPTGSAPLTDFEEVVLEGAMPLPGDPYPPPGHGFPRQGWGGGR